MGQLLEALQRLQVVELQLAELRADREVKARRVVFHERRVKDADRRIEQSQPTVRNKQIRLDALQLDVSAREESTNKHRQALNAAKTNKEYSSILTAMNTEKADMAKIETEMLQLMEETQAVKDEATRIEAEKSTILEDVARARKTVEAFDKKNKSLRTDLERRREELAKDIEPPILASFTRVADHHDGEAMVTVSKMHPKRQEYLCDGCNMKITLEVVNALQTRDELQICGACGRILYLPSPAKQGAGA